MGIRRFGTSGLSLLVVVGAVVALGAATEGCIYHEADDIVFPDPGHKWCTTLINAQAWDSDPNITSNIADGGQWPSAWCLLRRVRQRSP